MKIIGNCSSKINEFDAINEKLKNFDGWYTHVHLVPI